MIFLYNPEQDLLITSFLLSKFNSTDFASESIRFTDTKLFFFLGSYRSFLFAGVFLSYVLFAIKFYRVLCYTTLTVDALPVINPYIWPSSAIRAYTRPYFQFWKKHIPQVRLQKKNFDVSYLIGIEAFEIIVFLISSLQQNLYAQAELLYDKIYF